MLLCFGLRVSSLRRLAAAQVAFRLVLAITAATSPYSGADRRASRDSISLCTVDLDTPSTLAVFLTVAPVAAIYSASRSTLRSIA